MNYREQLFYLKLEKIILLFKNLELILKIAKQNIEKEKLNDKFLSLPILDNYTDIIENYRLQFENLSEMNSKEMDINRINGWIAGYGRSFENPLLFSIEWYHKIIRIQQELSECFREIEDFLLNQND